MKFKQVNVEKSQVAFVEDDEGMSLALIFIDHLNTLRCYFYRDATTKELMIISKWMIDYLK